MNEIRIRSQRLSQAKVHFIGIGGIGMCGLAELLHNMGAKVSGSDLTENTQTLYLQNLGIQVFSGHRPEHIGNAEVVVYSSAVTMQNPEYREARQRGIPLIPRAEALAEVMRLKRGIAIAGTHGKTTTTSMTASVFIGAQLDPTIVVGGRLDVIKSTAQLGQGEWLIAEADESDGSFNRLSPEIVIVTNIDNDHLDHYRDFGNLKSAFADFASRVPFFGLAIVCGDDPVIREVYGDFPKRIVYYGFEKNNDFVLEGGNGIYQVSSGSTLLGEMRVPLPGRHNALNALAAVVAGLTAGIEFEICAQGIGEFRGVDRRFQKIGEAQEILFFDDYGHHPTEVKAVLSAFKEKFPQQRLVVLFQPHRHSRTQLCWTQFFDCFEVADRLLMLDIYGAGESSIEGVSAQKLVDQLHHPQASYINAQNEDAFKKVADFLRSGDVFVTLGAGDVWKWGRRLLRHFQEVPGE